MCFYAFIHACICVRMCFCVDAPTEDLIEQWLAEGDVSHLETIVLDGRSHLLIDKDSVNIASIEFLASLNQYQVGGGSKSLREGIYRKQQPLSFLW